jgi:sigma-B regulation protein RsbU (phosphoserine phosphatase)
MAKGVGGDYFAIRDIGHHEWWVILCDVSGKGISASLITTLIDGMLSVFDTDKGIKSFIKGLNHYIADTFKMEKFVTGVFMSINDKSGKVKIFDMGHCMGSGNAYIIRNKKMMIIANKNFNIALGIYPDISIQFDVFHLKKGDGLFLITDGLTDQRNSSNLEIGIKPAAKIITSHWKKSLTAIKNRLFDFIHQYKETSTQMDDMTMILVRYHS